MLTIQKCVPSFCPFWQTGSLSKLNSFCLHKRQILIFLQFFLPVDVRACIPDQLAREFEVLALNQINEFLLCQIFYFAQAVMIFLELANVSESATGFNSCLCSRRFSHIAVIFSAQVCSLRLCQRGSSTRHRTASRVPRCQVPIHHHSWLRVKVGLCCCPVHLVEVVYRFEIWRIVVICAWMSRLPDKEVSVFVAFFKKYCNLLLRSMKGFRVFQQSLFMPRTCSPWANFMSKCFTYNVLQEDFIFIFIFLSIFYYFSLLLVFQALTRLSRCLSLLRFR